MTIISGIPIRPGCQPGYAPRVTYSFNRPPAGMTGFLLLIFVQLIALKAWVRKQYGPGVLYWYAISRWGRVSLRHMPIDFAERSYAAAGALRSVTALTTVFVPSRRLLEALAPEPHAVIAPVHEQCAPSAHLVASAVRFDSS